MKSCSLWLRRVALVLALSFSSFQAPGAPAPGQPNVLVILVDDLGYGDLGSYGAPDLQTPRVDKLVASGLRFDSFYANCPVCSPTRASLLSGRYPDLVGVPGVIRTSPEDNWGYLAPVTLLPDLLHKAGYHTALVGKWHLGLDSPNTPNERGFDHFHGFMGDMMDDYFDHRRHGKNYMRLNRETIDPTGHATDLFTDWTIDYLGQRRGKPEPFFLYLAYNAPHTPIQPPPEWLERVRQRDPAMPEKRAKLVALIEHLDHGIGRVLDALKQNGQEENTLVIFTSDNGGQLSIGARCGPLRGGKQDLYEGGIRVPMCASWPGHIQPGRRTSQVALTMDLFPTIAQAVGITPQVPLDGISLLPLFLGQTDNLPARDLFWVRREGGPSYAADDYRAIRRGSWKLMRNGPFEPYRLYQLDADPTEAQDVAAKNPVVVRELRAALMRQIQRSGSVPWQKPLAPTATVTP